MSDLPIHNCPTEIYCHFLEILFLGICISIVRNHDKVLHAGLNPRIVRLWQSPPPVFLFGPRRNLTQKKPLKFLAIVLKNTWPVSDSLKEREAVENSDPVVYERETRTTTRYVVVHGRPPLLVLE